MRLDWAGLMQAGMLRREMGGLGLMPEVFWRLSPAELRLMLRANGQPPLTRAALEAMISAYPDDLKGENDDRSFGPTGAD